MATRARTTGARDLYFSATLVPTGSVPTGQKRIRLRSGALCRFGLSHGRSIGSEKEKKHDTQYYSVYRVCYFNFFRRRRRDGGKKLYSVRTTNVGHCSRRDQRTRYSIYYYYIIYYLKFQVKKIVFNETGCWCDVTLAPGQFKKDLMGFCFSRKF